MRLKIALLCCGVIASSFAMKPIPLNMAEAKVVIAPKSPKQITYNKQDIYSDFLRQPVVEQPQPSEPNKPVIEIAKQEAIAQRKTIVASRGGDPQEVVLKELTVWASGYVATGNRTFTGTTPKPNRTIAVDPRLIPLGSRIQVIAKPNLGVDISGWYVAEDTGGYIQGNRVDVFFASKTDAINWGRHQVKLIVYKN